MVIDMYKTEAAVMVNYNRSRKICRYKGQND